MAGSSCKDFECITSGYPLRDYQACITISKYFAIQQNKSYKVFYTQGVQCVCVCVYVWGREGGRGEHTPCETVEHPGKPDIGISEVARFRR